MLPMVVDLARLKLVLVGNGDAAERRLRRLDAAGALDLTVYADAPASSLALAAGRRLRQRLPTVQELATAQLVFISDRSAPWCRHFAAAARAGGALVHVEDEPALSDLHAPAVLERGDLLIAVSTGGKSPGLAARIKSFLGALFGPEWQQRLDRLAELRQGWRRGGADPETVAQWTTTWVTTQGWLPADDPVGASAPQVRGDRVGASARELTRKH